MQGKYGFLPGIYALFMLFQFRWNLFIMGHLYHKKNSPAIQMRFHLYQVFRRKSKRVSGRSDLSIEKEKRVCWLFLLLTLSDLHPSTRNSYNTSQYACQSR